MIEHFFHLLAREAFLVHFSEQQPREVRVLKQLRRARVAFNLARKEHGVFFVLVPQVGVFEGGDELRLQLGDLGEREGLKTFGVVEVICERHQRFDGSARRDWHLNQNRNGSVVEDARAHFD